MKALLYSDVHLEFGSFKHPKTDGFDIALLAGDIAPGYTGLAWAGQHFGPKAFYVAGNHEFYNHEINETYRELFLRTSKHHNVVFLQDTTFQGVTEAGENFRVIGGTLWTDYKLDKSQDYGMYIGERSMNDYRLITETNDQGKEFRFTATSALKRHMVTLVYFETELAKPFDGKTIVMSHMGCTPQSINRKYVGSEMNHLYTSDLTWLIEKYQPDLWVHGHTHTSNDYMVGKTRVVTNPRGYIGYGPKGGPENFNFNPELILEV